MPRTCKFRDCTRPAHRGWTTCGRHHSAGDSIKNERRKAEARKNKFRKNP